MIAKIFKQSKDKELMRLLILKWVCDKQPWASKNMHVLSQLFGKEFTTKDLPLKNSRSHELIKEWEQKGLIKVTDYTSKTRKYAYTTTLFAKAIEEQKIENELKQAMMEILDDLIAID